MLESWCKKLNLLYIELWDRYEWVHIPYCLLCHKLCHCAKFGAFTINATILVKFCKNLLDDYGI